MSDVAPAPADPTPATPGVPAGWYPESGRQRWWDGAAWGDYAPVPVTVVVPPTAPTNGIAVAGMILSIFAAVTALIPLVGWFFFPLPALLAVIFGFVGLNTASANNGLRKTEARAAIFLGFSPVVIVIGQLIIGSLMNGAS